jgi:hypothetical protein
LPPLRLNPHCPAIPSSKVDLPVPFSPTMMVIGRSKLSASFPRWNAGIVK